MEIKISFITTVNHNIGDDFIREGIKFILKKFFKNEKKLDFINIHKHTPLTVRKGFENIRLDKISSILDIDKLIPQFLGSDHIQDSDILIQSGAPVFWCHPNIPKQIHCADNEWYDAFIKRRLKKIRKKTKFLNLAAGSCQTWDGDGKEIYECPKCNPYVKELISVTDLTTVRDNLAKRMLGYFNIDVPLIPCTSIFAVDELGIKPDRPDYVALNFMKGGAHFVFGQPIDVNKWEETFRAFYKTINKLENCIFVCHNKEELSLAKKIDSNAKVFMSKSYLEYLKFYSKAKFGIMNRIHGAFPILSLGRPAIIIGNDSRAKMAEEVGAESFFVNDITYETLINNYEKLNSGYDNFEERFHTIKKNALSNYLDNLLKIF